MAGFAEVLDEIQTANAPSSFGQTQRASYPTIMSKFRSKNLSFFFVRLIFLNID